MYVKILRDALAPYVPKWMFFTHRGKGGRGSNPCENIQSTKIFKNASVLVHEGVPYHRKITCDRTFFFILTTIVIMFA